VVAARLDRRREEVDLSQVADSSTLLAMQQTVETVQVDESVGRYAVALVEATRTHHEVLTGASPRASLGLVLTARAFAVLHGRDFVTPEDIKSVARAVLSHRITVKPELWLTEASGDRVVDIVLQSVPTPTTLEGSTVTGAPAGTR
jgi:MoxR-like ATPase